MLTGYTLEKFSEILGSNSPAPGGGSVSALAGSLGADLLAMVCSLSVGLPEFESDVPIIKEIHDKAIEMSKILMKRVDLDTAAFNSVMKAYRLPKSSEGEKSVRRAVIEEGFKEAIRSPFNIALECLEILKCMEKLLGKFNHNALSDLGVGAQMARAGLEGAVMNVKINIPQIKDRDYADKVNEQAEQMIREGGMIGNVIYRYVNENLD